MYILAMNEDYSEGNWKAVSWAVKTLLCGKFAVAFRNCPTSPPLPYTSLLSFWSVSIFEVKSFSAVILLWIVILYSFGVNCLFSG
jgi:hypothetical protein